MIALKVALSALVVFMVCIIISSRETEIVVRPIGLTALGVMIAAILVSIWTEI